VEAGKRADENRIASASEAKLAHLGEPPLAERNRVLRVAPRREREVRQRRQEWRGESGIESLDQRQRELAAPMLRHRHPVPKPAVSEQMVVLALVPGAVRQ